MGTPQKSNRNQSSIGSDRYMMQVCTLARRRTWVVPAMMRQKSEDSCVFDHEAQKGRELWSRNGTTDKEGADVAMEK